MEYEKYAYSYTYFTTFSLKTQEVFHDIALDVKNIPLFLQFVTVSSIMVKKVQENLHGKDYQLYH